MTKSIHFIGDSHLVPIYNGALCLSSTKQINNEDVFLDYPNEEWRGAYKMSTDTLYSFHIKPGRLAYNSDYTNLAFSKLIKAGDKVVACMGECDVRLYLHKYNNTKEVVEAYVKNTVESFPDNEVFFLTPLPQTSDEYTVTLDGEDFSFDADIRLAEHKNFVKHLTDICSELSLPEPIDISLGAEFLELEDRSEDLLHMSFLKGKAIAKHIESVSALHQ